MLVNRLTAKLLNRSTAKLMSRLTAKLVDLLTAKLVVLNPVIIKMIIDQKRHALKTLALKFWLKFIIFIYFLDKILDRILLDVLLCV